MKTLGFISIIIFTGAWGFLTKKFLPNDMIDGNNNKFDERETKILLEVASNTLVWIVYALLFSILSKLVGLSNLDKMRFPHYPEIYFIILIGILFLFNLFYVRNKYSVKG
ncbi:hypothetical protein ERX37_01285 [Macrococcus hajekii]|uniref:Uncharacterized protein n=1 Tax=Macrococcus hajekii TaxID=198482 RepID=A0A4R6BM00_9STAP|nr:hypothetical protein [Macrococcus hajekii]TDM02751.1 hypothetical protein ERX37_01285 [Macrococcus hajekii]GGB03591.1 hypothetical protein GCM10007190_09510 [Macrococcus hajekii]